MSQAVMTLHRPPARWPVVVIGIGKLLKAAGLVAVGHVVKMLLSPEQHQAWVDFVEQSRVDPHNVLVHGVLTKLLAIPVDQLHVLRVGAYIYAGLYLIEALGLFWDRKWAEWMVIVTTAGFLPLEIYEIWRQVTWGRCMLLVVNVVVVGYLVWRLRRLWVVKRERLAAGFPVAGKGLSGGVRGV